MPPSVARSQLPKGSAHATKEPLRTAPVRAFLELCCTNNTQPWSGFPCKLLFYLLFFAARPADRIGAASALHTRLSHFPGFESHRIVSGIDSRARTKTSFPREAANGKRCCSLPCSRPEQLRRQHWKYKKPLLFRLNLHQPILPSESSTRQRQSNECDFRAIASRLHGTVCMPTILDLRTREAAPSLANQSGAAA